MDIAKLGVAIDPTQAVAGADRAKRAITDIGNTAKTELQKAEEAARRAGNEAQTSAKKAERAAQDAKRGMNDFQRGIIDAAQAAGMMGGPVGQLISRTVSFISTVQAMRNGLNALAAAQEAQRAATIAAAAASAGATTSQAAAATAATAAAAANATNATAATSSAAAAGAMAGASTAAAAASTSLAVSSTATAAGITSVGIAATATTTALAAMNSQMITSQRVQRANNAPRLTGPAKGMTIDIDAQVVNRVKNLDSGLSQLATTAGRLPPPLTAIGAGASEAGAGAVAGGAGVAGFVAIAAGAIAVIGALVIAVKLLAVSWGLVREGMDLAGPVQRTRVALTTMTGSVTEANRILMELRKNSRATGAELGPAMDTVKKFIALQFSPDNAIKLNRSINDIAGAVGLTAEEAKGLGNALAQVQAKGVVAMEELRQQIAEKGVPVFQELANKLTKGNVAALNKMVADGKVASKDLIDIFLNMEGGFAKMAGGAQKMTATFPGAIAKLKAIWADLLVSLGEPVNTALVPVINKLSTLLESLIPVATSIGEGIATGITALFNAINSGQLTELLRLALYAGIEQAASLFVSLWQAQIILLINFAVSSLSSAIQSVVEFVSSGFTTVINFITELVKGNFSGAFQIVVDFFGNLFTGGGGILSNIAVAIRNALGQAMIDVVNTFIQAFYKAWASVSNLVDAGKAQFGVAPTSLGPVAPKPLTFTPTPLGPGQINNASNALVGTGNRDAFMDQYNKLGQSPQFVGPPKPYVAPVIPPSGPIAKTGGGSGGAEDKIPKAKVVTELDTEVQKLLKSWVDLETQMDKGLANLGQSVATNLTDGIMSVVDGTKSLKEAFAGMATSIVNDIIKMVVQMMIQLAIAEILFAMGYTGGGGAGYSVGGTKVAHTGGVVGSSNFATNGAPQKFHTGGVSSAESMIKVDKGETILTRRRARELEAELKASRQDSQPRESGVGGGTATIINVLDRSEVADAIAKNPGAVVNAISRHLPQVRKMVMSGQRN
jgi:tape measure domain-containing protein